ncbi:BPSS1780 family membrane protein [Coralloluteibacterium stylophorae]|uniref:DUF4013 domain-containing protein n=1 Tax=Coralloluteibacterium stylophorae TaxID=1776034 RepID=A0A8J7VUK3_9GAMM|nr:BPSS1780 family membrane protein [Coralloluteibacterium stylophorae]MBS7457121.1 hypothetical protein [Coralloluteibacterium stylophorae]
MSHRRVAAGRGAGWIVDGFDIVRRNPGTFALIGLVFGAIVSVPLLGAIVSLLSPVFYAGYLSAVRTEDRGGRAQVGQVFDGFAKPGAFLRMLPIVLVSIGVGVLALIVMVAFMGGELMALAQAGTTDPSPEQLAALAGPFLQSLVVLLPIGLLFGWTSFFAQPRAMLGEVSGLRALGDGFRALWSNLPALLVNLLCWIVIGVVLTIGIGLFSLLGAALGSLLQFVVQFVMNMLLMAVVAAIYVPSMYRAWQEVFGDDAATEVPPPAPQGYTAF